ncbi:MAG: hypothetical protein IJ594_07860 [Oscillospiraceae bacterium]|nr:hypothetical protein [Oscillospiraceae bacterium]
MSSTSNLFTFELDLGSGTERLAGQQLEDILYNCLDFCLLYRKQAHFFLTGPDAAGHPELWRVLEILREEGATFSLLSEPERSEYETLRSKELQDRIRISAEGEASCELGALGNVLCDRLGDLWEIKQMEARSHE